MRKTLGSLIVKLGLDPKEVEAGLKKFERSLKDTARRMQSVGQSMTIGFTAPFLLGISKAIKAYDEEAQVVKKLEVALGRTSKALLDQASALQKTTIYSDDAIIAQQAYAAALGHSEQEIQSMTTAAVGLASGLGIGLDQAMSMLHKSTLGASKGLGNLVPGVKELTKEQLKAGGAIDLVNKKFAGFGEAAAKAGTGPLKVFQNRFGDLMEQFGEAALPLLNKIIALFEKLTSWFEKLSPSTKSLVVNIGAFVALAGPIIFMTGKMITMTQAVIGLGAAFKGLGVAAGGALGPISALLSLGSLAYANNVEAVTPNNLVHWASKITLNKFGNKRSSMYGQNPGLMPGLQAPNNGNMLNFPAPSRSGGGGGGGSAKASMAALIAQVKNFGAFGAGGAGGAGNIGFTANRMPSIGSLGMSGVSGGGRDNGMGGIMPDMTASIEAQTAALENYKATWQTVGDAIGGMIAGMGADMKAGMSFFAAFGKAALKAAAQVAKAALAETAVRLIAHSSKAGIPGLIIGFAAAGAAIAAIEGLIGNIKAPALARGGVTTGPMMAMIGDNPSGKEMALPFERNNEFADAIGRRLSGGGGSQRVEVVGIIRGNDIHLVAKKSQDSAIRRGSGNVITFGSKFSGKASDGGDG